jgi:hypothetical protein
VYLGFFGPPSHAARPAYSREQDGRSRSGVFGRLEEALKARSEAPAILERLTAADPSNSGWKRDLWAHIPSGEMLDAHGSRDQALKRYREALLSR